MKVDQQTLKDFNNLTRAVGYNGVLSYLTSSYEEAITGLLAATPEKMPTLQGKAQTLKQIIDLFEHKLN